MSTVRYDTIEPNIAHVDVDGGQVLVQWRCAATGREVGQSCASMAADASLAGRVRANVKRTIVSEIVYGAARLVAGLLGGVAGRVVGNAAYTAAGDLDAKLTAGVDYSAASREAAIVSAFESMKEAFAWDEARGRFVAR